VSGVVFPISQTSVKREVNGKSLWFCCEGCAGYFDQHQQKLIELRKLSL
jgi:YHS domain-containing protein